MSSTQKTTYLFVDGSNFRQYFDEITQKWFGQEVEFDFFKVKDFFGAEKAFYYDCIDYKKRDSETEEDYKRRVTLQEEKLNKIHEVKGCHVHLGSVRNAKKQKRRGQKEVDVMLAVEMMEHAFRGNMSRAVLLSGDLDFRPLVESLVRLGLFVEVAGDKNHISPDLILSADSHKKLSIDEYYDFVPHSIQEQKKIEVPSLSFFIERADSEKFFLTRKGIWKGHEVYVFVSNRHAGNWFTTTDKSIHNDSAWVSNNLENLILYFELKYGNIEWLNR